MHLRNIVWPNTKKFFLFLKKNLLFYFFNRLGWLHKAKYYILLEVKSLGDPPFHPKCLNLLGQTFCHFQPSVLHLSLQIEERVSMTTIKLALLGRGKTGSKVVELVDWENKSLCPHRPSIELTTFHRENPPTFEALKAMTLFFPFCQVHLLKNLSLF